MNKILFILAILIFSFSAGGQGKTGDKKDKDKTNPVVTPADNKGKSKDKQQKGNEEDLEKEKQLKAQNDEHDRKVWDGIGDKSCRKPSKNQPAKVRASFYRDFPHASVVRWTKCRGDWTATFGNGFFLSTAIYHANGDRRDIRTPILKNQLPRIVLDSIFKRRPGINLGDIIKIEIPGGVNDIFRIKADVTGQAEFLFFNSLGKVVTYNY